MHVRNKSFLEKETHIVSNYFYDCYIECVAFSKKKIKKKKITKHTKRTDLRKKETKKMTKG